MAPMRKLEHAHGPWNADRATAFDRGLALDWLSGLVEEAVRPCRCRRSLAAVVAAHAPLGVGPMQQECAAADSGRLRLYEAKHHLHSDRGIDSVAASAQDLETRVRCEGIRRDDHLSRRKERFFFLAAGRRLGRYLRRGRQGRDGKQ